MMRHFGRYAGLALCALAIACGPRQETERGTPGRSRTCPVCGTTFPSDQVVVVSDPCGEALLCSRGCAVRYSVPKLPTTEGAETRHPGDRQPQSAAPGKRG